MGRRDPGNQQAGLASFTISGTADTRVATTGTPMAMLSTRHVGNAVPVAVVGDFTAQDEQVGLPVVVEHHMVGQGAEPPAVSRTGPSAG